MRNWVWASEPMLESQAWRYTLESQLWISKGRMILELVGQASWLHRHTFSIARWIYLPCSFSRFRETDHGYLLLSSLFSVRMSYHRIHRYCHSLLQQQEEVLAGRSLACTISSLGIPKLTAHGSSSVISRCRHEGMRSCIWEESEVKYSGFFSVAVKKYSDENLFHLLLPGHSPALKEVAAGTWKRTMENAAHWFPKG